MKGDAGHKSANIARKAKRLLYGLVVDGQEPTFGRVAYLLLMFLLFLFSLGAIFAFLGMPAIAEAVSSPDRDFIKVLKTIGAASLFVLPIAFFGARFWLSARALATGRALHPDCADESTGEEGEKAN